MADLKKTTQPLSSWIRSASDDNEDEIAGSDSFATPFTEEGTKALKTIFDSKVFDYPKPPTLIRELLRQASGEDDIVLDFFAGSGTTAQAVLELNAEDGGDRRFILVSNTEANEKAPDKNLCRDVCAERVRRVIAGYAAPTKKQADRKIEGTGGEFLYLQTKTISASDVDFGASENGQFNHLHVWTLAAAVEGFPIAPGLPSPTVDGLCVSNTVLENGRTSHLAYLSEVTARGLKWLRETAANADVVVWTWSPSDLDGMPSNVRVVALPEAIEERWR